MKLKKVHAYLLLILLVGVVSAIFHGYHMIHNLPYHISYSDILPMYKRIILDSLPYVDYNIEYPVVTGIFIHSMKVIGKNIEGFYFWTSLFLIIFSLIGTYVLSKIDNKIIISKILSYWVLAPSMIIFMIYNWDIIALLFVICSLYFMKRQRYCLSSLFLALGFSSKFYPAIYLPILLAHNRKIKEWAKIIGVFGAVTLAINSFFMYANFNGWYYFFSFNSIRMPNYDSIWMIISYVLPQLTSYNINNISLIIFGISYLLVLWKFRHKEPIFLCFIMTLLFLLTNKIFSPQYMLWVLPFFVLLPVIGKKRFYSLEITNLAVLWAIMPYIFIKPQNAVFLYIVLIFVVIRHILLISLLLSNLKARKVH